MYKDIGVALSEFILLFSETSVSRERWKYSTHARCTKCITRHRCTIDWELLVYIDKVLPSRDRSMEKKYHVLTYYILWPCIYTGKEQ